MNNCKRISSDKMQDEKRRSFGLIAWLGFLDILSIIATLVIVLTIWKIPFLLKTLQINGYFRNYNFKFIQFSELDKIKLTKSAKKIFMGVHGIIIFTLINWSVDIPLVFLKMILYIICPWRLFINQSISSETRIPQAFAFLKAFNKARSRELFLSLAYIFLDYFTIVECIILSLTVVKFEIVVKTFRQLSRSKREGDLESAMLEAELEIGRQFVILICDIFLCLLCLITFLLIVKSASLYTRLHKIIVHHINLQKLLKSSKRFYEKTQSKAKIFGVSNNLFMQIMTFIDINDIAKFSLTCKNAKSKTSSEIIWRKHFDHTYFKFAIMTQSATYRERCISAYLNHKRNNAGQVQQDEWDWIMGWRVIVLESLIASIWALPHLILLPLKLLGFLLNFLLIAVNKAHSNLLNTCNFYMIIENDREFYPGYNALIELNKFNYWKLHNVFIDRVIQIGIKLCIILGYWYMQVIYGFCYALSAGKVTHIAKNISQKINTYAPGIRINNAGLEYMQAITFPIYILLLAFPVIIVPAIYYFGMAPILFKSMTVVVFMTIFMLLFSFNVIATAINLLDFFPNYNPVYAIVKITKSACSTCKNGVSSVLASFGTAVRSIFTSVFLPLLKLLTKRSGKLVKFLIAAIQLPPKIIYRVYFGILSVVYKYTRSFGTAGEIILLVVGMVLMFWPMCLPFVIKQNTHRLTLWIVSIVSTGILTVFGKKRLDKEMKIK